MYNNRPQIKIGNKWSFEAWGALLGSGWNLSAAKPKTAYLEVPARDGSIDITDVLSGEPRYNRRELNFKLVFIAAETEWEHLRQDVENFCNGLKLPITLPHDQSHYLLGRVSTGNFTRGQATAELDVSVNCDPWRYKNKETVVQVVLPAEGTLSRVLKNERRRTIPRIITDAPASITINSVTQNVSAGEFKFTDFILEPGRSPVTINAAEGTTVKFIYQEAIL